MDRRPDTDRQAGADRTWRATFWPETGADDISEDDFIDGVGGNTCSLQGSLDGRGSERRGGDFGREPRKAPMGVRDAALDKWVRSWERSLLDTPCKQGG